MPAPQYHALIVDDEAPVRKLVSAALTKEGFACDLAADGVEALHQVAAKQYDAVVTDLRMPNRHGHALAVDLLNLVKRPVIIIHTGVIEPRLAKDLLSRGVDDIVFKPVSLPILATKVKTLVERKHERANLPGVPQPAAADPAAQADERVAITPDDLQSRLGNLSGVLPISHAALEVYRLATSDECEAGEMVDVIEKDGSLTAELLRIGNSAQYNPAGARTGDLQQIVLRVGRRRIGEVALAANALASLTARTLPWLDVGLTWQRSLAARVAMEQLIEMGGHQYLESGLLLTASMHALGRVVLGTLYPLHYERMLGACQTTGGTLREQEKRTLPHSYAEVMALVLTDWKVPSEVHYPLRYALDSYSEVASLSGPARIRVELLKLAILIGRVAVGAWMPWDTVEVPGPSVLERLRVKSLPHLIDRVRAGLRELLQEFGRPPCGPQAATPPRRLGYAAFVGEDQDPLAPLLLSVGIQLDRCAIEKIVEHNRPHLVNGVGIDSQLLIDALTQTAPGTHTVVCEATKSKELAALLRVAELPSGFGRLLSLCEEVAKG